MNKIKYTFSQREVDLMLQLVNKEIQNRLELESSDSEFGKTEDFIDITNEVIKLSKHLQVQCQEIPFSSGTTKLDIKGTEKK